MGPSPVSSPVPLSSVVSDEMAAEKSSSTQNQKETKIPTEISISVFTVIPFENGSGGKLAEKLDNEIDKETAEKGEICLWRTYGGILMSLSASIFFSLSFLMIKALENHGIKAFGAALLFNTGVLLPAIIAMIFNEYFPGYQNRKRILQGLWPINWNISAFMAIQGILQGSSVVFRTFSLGYLSVGDMTVIVFSSPVVTTILAHFIVHEPCGVSFIFIAFFTLVGVGLITKPPVLTGQKEFDKQTLIGSGFAAGALLTLSMKFVVTRKIKDTHFLTMTFFLGFFGILISLPLFLIFEDPRSLIPTSSTGLWLRIGMFTGFCSVASINLALKMEDAGVVALVRSSDVIFAFILQYLFLGVIPDTLSAIGAGMVWTGVFVAGMRKYWNSKSAKKLTKKKVRRSVVREEGYDHDITKYNDSQTEVTKM